MHRPLLSLIAVAALIALPAPAEAQFDRLVKKAAEKLAQPEGKPAEPGGTAATASPRSTATSSHITTDQLDRFIAAVGPAAQQAAQRSTWRAEQQANERKAEQIASCRQQAMAASAATPAAVDDKEMDRINALNESLSSRLSATTDLARQRVLSDSMMLVMEQLYEAMYPAMKRCGARPALSPEPPPVDAAGVAERAKAAGFSTAQFGQLRERIGVWLTTRETRGLSAESAAALEQRSSQLDALSAYFTEVQWGTWRDLPTW